MTITMKVDKIDFDPKELKLLNDMLDFIGAMDDDIWSNIPCDLRDRMTNMYETCQELISYTAE